GCETSLAVRRKVLAQIEEPRPDGWGRMGMERDEAHDLIFGVLCAAADEDEQVVLAQIGTKESGLDELVEDDRVTAVHVGQLAKKSIARVLGERGVAIDHPGNEIRGGDGRMGGGTELRKNRCDACEGFRLIVVAIEEYVADGRPEEECLAEHGGRKAGLIGRSESRARLRERQRGSAQNGEKPVLGCGKGVSLGPAWIGAHIRQSALLRQVRTRASPGSGDGDYCLSAP